LVSLVIRSAWGLHQAWQGKGLQDVHAPEAQA